MTTHDFTFTKEFASRILIMNQGKLTKDGSFTQLFGREQDWLSYHFTCPLESKAALQANFLNFTLKKRKKRYSLRAKKKRKKMRFYATLKS